jgi:hypothetical protein
MVAFDERLYRKTYDTVERMGVEVTFTHSASEDVVYDETSEEQPDSSSVTVTGKAVEVIGDPDEYVALELIQSEPITLWFVPNEIGSLPGIGATVLWAGVLKTVQTRFPVRPAGRGLAARLVVA